MFGTGVTFLFKNIYTEKISGFQFQVVCRQLGFEHYSAWVDHGPRVEFDKNSLTRIWTYPEPLQCSGEFLESSAFIVVNVVIRFSNCC